MLILSKDDFYEVYLKSIITDYDRDTLTMLYQPIIGADAVILYLSLYSEFKKSKKGDSFHQHSDLASQMGYNTAQIQEARRKLEGIGLLETYYKKEKEIGFYKYLLFAPKTPQEFFDDILFKGLLIEKIGEKQVQALLRKYKEKPLDLEGFNEISDTFKNVFNPNLNSNSFNNKDNINGFGRKAIDVSKGFDSSLFLKTLEDNYSVVSESISKKDMKKLSEIALLYGISEIGFADIFSQCYENKEINYDKIKSLAIKEKDFINLRNNQFSTPIAYDTNSKLGKKIGIMSSYSCMDYLKLKLKNSMISPSDVKLINDLNDLYHLNTGVINCLVDFCIDKNGSLTKNYVTKIASSLAREEIDNTLDCMNYLRNYGKRRDYTKDNKSKQVVDSSTSQQNKEVDMSDSEIDELLSDL